MSREQLQAKRSLAILIGLFILMMAVALYCIATAKPLTEPTYQGIGLRGWIRAEPSGNMISYDDIIVYRRTALTAMGQPAVDYLHWMLAHPRKMIEGHATAFDRAMTRLGPYTPKFLAKLTEPPRDRLNFMNVVVALELIGAPARATAPGLVRLWESNGHFMYPTYNGFPLALSQLGNNSPEVLSALHRHFRSPDRLHRALCGFAAWKLEPTDIEAIRIVKQELSSSDSNTHPRYALVDSLGRWGGTNAQFFMEEILDLYAAPFPDPVNQQIAEQAVARIRGGSGLHFEKRHSLNGLTD